MFIFLQIIERKPKNMSVTQFDCSSDAVLGCTRSAGAKDTYVVLPVHCEESKEPYQLREDAPKEVREVRVELLKIINEQ